MPCISRSALVKSKAFSGLSCCLVLTFLLNNLQLATSTLSTIAPPLLNLNYSSHELTCSNVKDILAQRGISDKDLPTKFPIKGERAYLLWKRQHCVKRFLVVKWTLVSPFRGCSFSHRRTWVKKSGKFTISSLNILKIYRSLGREISFIGSPFPIPLTSHFLAMQRNCSCRTLKRIINGKKMGGSENKISEG